MQYEFQYVLTHSPSYTIERSNDTIIDNQHCFQIEIATENKISMPGFATRLEDKKGSISRTLYFIDKKTYYPIGRKHESYSIDNPGQKVFIDQKYYEIKYNLNIKEYETFNTSEESLKGYELKKMKPE
jgi:hypothetical protein